MFDKILADKIDSFIREKFPVIYDYKFDGLVFLRGGTIRSLIMGIPVNDLDIVILTQGKCQIKDFIRKFKLRYYKNAGGGYKIIYNGFSIDIDSYNDLLDTACYDIDYVFYDIEKHLFMICGALRAIEKRTITEVNSNMVALKKNVLRLKKIIRFVKYVTGNNRRVKVKQKGYLFKYKLYKKKFKDILKKIFDNSFRKCFQFLDGVKKESNLVFLFNILSIIVSLVIPILFGKLYLEILLESYIDIILIVLLIILSKILIMVSSKKVRKYRDVLKKKMSYNICRKISECVLNLELDNILQQDSSFINKISKDPDIIAMKFDVLINMMIKLSGNFIILVVIFYLNYKIGILFLISILIMAILKRYNIKSSRSKRGFFKKHISDMNKSLGTFGDMFYFRDDMVIDDSQLINEDSNTKVKTIYNLSFVIIFVCSLVLVCKDNLEVPSFIVIFFYGIMLYDTENKINKLLREFFFLSRSCYRLFNLIDGTIYVREVFGNKYNTECFGKIEFSHVKFRYNYESNYILDDCSFNANINEVLAIVGKNNSGKTTILNLIARLYNVDDGVLKIDGVNIDEYSENFIRENVSIISQNPYLFDMSIKDNLRLVKDNITDDEIKEVCKLVCMEEFIESLPNKYDTIIGCDGIKLSGSQKQRLGIARALIKNIKIILLDNIFDECDNEEKTIIKQVIKNIQKNHTIIIVTHELSMIEDCSRILVLDDGKIVGDGTHRELIKNNDVYSGLWKVK